MICPIYNINTVRVSGCVGCMYHERDSTEESALTVGWLGPCLRGGARVAGRRVTVAGRRAAGVHGAG